MQKFVWKSKAYTTVHNALMGSEISMYWVQMGFFHTCIFFVMVIDVWDPCFPLNGTKKYLTWQLDFHSLTFCLFVFLKSWGDTEADINTTNNMHIYAHTQMHSTSWSKAKQEPKVCVQSRISSWSRGDWWCRETSSWWSAAGCCPSPPLPGVSETDTLYETQQCTTTARDNIYFTLYTCSKISIQTTPDLSL